MRAEQRPKWNVCVWRAAIPIKDVSATSMVAEEMEDKMLEQQQMVMFVSILFFLQPSHMRHHFYFRFVLRFCLVFRYFYFAFLAARIRDPNRIGKLDISAAECARLNRIEYTFYSAILLCGDAVRCGAVHEARRLWFDCSHSTHTHVENGSEYFLKCSCVRVYFMVLYFCIFIVAALYL